MKCKVPAFEHDIRLGEPVPYLLTLSLMGRGYSVKTCPKHILEGAEWLAKVAQKNISARLAKP